MFVSFEPSVKLFVQAYLRKMLERGVAPLGLSLECHFKHQESIVAKFLFIYSISLGRESGPEMTV